MTEETYFHCMKYFVIPLYPLLFFFCFGNTLIAQEQMPKLAIGATGGLQASFIQFTPGGISDNLLGSHAGIHLQYMSRKMLGFETALLFTQIGWKIVDAATQTSASAKVTAIEFPLNSHLAIGKGPFRFLVDAGPYLRFFTNTTYPDGDIFPSRPIENDISYGLNFAGGLGWRSTKFIVQLKGNFHLGLTNYFTPVIDDITVSAERSIGGSLSILLPIGKKYIDE